MTIVLLACAVVLAIDLTLGLVRLARGPEPVDRLAAGQLIGTLGIAILLILAETTGEPTLRLVAFLLAALGAITIAAYLRVEPIVFREPGP